MPALTLRPATPADIPAMLEIYSPYVKNTTVSLETEVPSAAAFSVRFGSLCPRLPWLVCEWGNEIAGYAYAAPFGERGGFNWSAETSVYISPRHRGIGAGRALYTALFTLMQAQGYHTLYARIVTPNAESEGFHKACGFVANCVLANAGCKFGRFLNLAYYSKTLLPYKNNPPAVTAFEALDKQTVDKACLEAIPRP